MLLDEASCNLPCARLEIDELWAFVGKKQQRNVTAKDGADVGDQWTFVAIDADTKLVPSFMVGKRDAETTQPFIDDVASRLKNRVRISTDGLTMYIRALDAAFGDDVDYAQIVKSYEAEPIGPGRYLPPKVTTVEETQIIGEPVAELVSTSYVKRQNLAVRMGARRCTRLTNGFSKKLENHIAATALHFAHHNFVRRHMTLCTTPAIAAGVMPTMWSLGDLLDVTFAGAA